MKYADHEIQKLKNEFKKRKSVRITLFVFSLAFLIIVGLIAFPIMETLGIQKRIWAPIVYIIMFGIIIAITFVWRCPVCNGLMGDVFNTKYCSKCGFKFVDKTEEKQDN